MRALPASKNSAAHAPPTQASPLPGLIAKRHARAPLPQPSRLLLHVFTELVLSCHKERYGRDWAPSVLQPQ